MVLLQYIWQWLAWHCTFQVVSRVWNSVVSSYASADLATLIWIIRLLEVVSLSPSWFPYLSYHLSSYPTYIIVGKWWCWLYFSVYVHDKMRRESFLTDDLNSSNAASHKKEMLSWNKKVFLLVCQPLRQRNCARHTDLTFTTPKKIFS